MGSDLPSPRGPGVNRLALVWVAIGLADIGQRHERAYYLSEVNFAASNILARFPDAAFRIVLLGRPGDADPHRPAGRLEPRERP